MGAGAGAFVTKLKDFELPDVGEKFVPKHGDVKGQSINVVLICEALGYSQKDINRLWRHFIQADLTGNHVLCIREFCIMHQIFNRSFGKLVFAIFDYDNSGDITFEEFCIAAWNSFTLDDSALPMFAFRLFDKDNSGALSANELRKMLKIVCGKNEKTIEVANRYIRENDVNEDGLISASEFLAITKRSQLIMFPAFQMRDHMRHRILNYSRWQALTAKRMEMFPGLMLPDILASLPHKPEGYKGLFVAASSSGGYLLPSLLPSQKLFDVPVVRMNTEGGGGKAIAAREGEIKVTIGGRSVVKSGKDIPGKDKEKDKTGKSTKDNKKSPKNDQNTTITTTTTTSVKHEKDVQKTLHDKKLPGGGGVEGGGGGQRGSVQSSVANTPVPSVPTSPRTTGNRVSFTTVLGQGPHKPSGPGPAPTQAQALGLMPGPFPGQPLTSGHEPLRSSIESLNKRLSTNNENGQGYIGLGTDSNVHGTGSATGGAGAKVPLASLGGHGDKKPHTHLSSVMALMFGEKTAPIITETAEKVAYALLDIDLSQPRPMPTTTLGQSIAAATGEKDKKNKENVKGGGHSIKVNLMEQSGKSSNNGHSQKRGDEMTGGGGGQSGSGLVSFLNEEKKTRKRSLHDHAMKYEYKGGNP